MAGLILRRLAVAVPTVWLVATLTFVVVHAAPGSYADSLDHPRLTPVARAALHERWGLDDPLPQQYLRWLGGLATGDLGTSFVAREPVVEVLARAIPPTLLLAAAALALDLVVGVLLAMAAARRPAGAVDRLISVFGLTVYGLPVFWVAGLAVLGPAVAWGWFPPSHMTSIGASALPWPERALDLLHHLVLPATCLGLAGAGGTARYLRSTLLELRHERFVLAARARGIPEWRIRWLHTLRPALTPVVTLLGLSLPFLVGGSVVIETVFSWPGMGSLVVASAHARDVPVIMAATVLGGLAVVTGNLVADILYAVVDPRAREHL